MAVIALFAGVLVFLAGLAMRARRNLTPRRRAGDPELIEAQIARHAEIVIKELGLAEAKASKVPGSKDAIKFLHFDNISFKKDDLDIYKLLAFPNRISFFSKSFRTF